MDTNTASGSNSEEDAFLHLVVDFEKLILHQNAQAQGVRSSPVAHSSRAEATMQMNNRSHNDRNALPQSKDLKANNDAQIPPAGPARYRDNDNLAANFASLPINTDLMWQLDYAEFLECLQECRRKLGYEDREDITAMRAAGLFDSKVTKPTGWSIKQADNLFQEIIKMTKDIIKNQWKSYIGHLQEEYKTKKKTVCYELQISFLYLDIDVLNKMPLKDVARHYLLPIDHEYVWDAVSIALDQGRSAQECRAFWKTYLYPSINKLMLKNEKVLELN